MPIRSKTCNRSDKQTTLARELEPRSFETNQQYTSTHQSLVLLQYCDVTAAFWFHVASTTLRELSQDDGGVVNSRNFSPGLFSCFEASNTTDLTDKDICIHTYIFALVTENLLVLETFYVWFHV